MTHICVVTSVHPVWDIRIFRREVRTLSQAGYKVTLIAPHNREERVEGIRVIPLLKTSHRLERITRMPLRIIGVLLRCHPDIVHIHDPELIPCALFMKILGKKVIYDVHEDLPRQISTKLWIRPWIRRWMADAAQAMEKMAGIMFDGIVAATPRIAERFPKSKTMLVQNFPDVADFAEGDHPYQKRRSILFYHGVLSAQRGIREIVAALAFLPAEPDLRLRLAGCFYPPSLQMELQKHPMWTRVEYLGFLSYPRVRDEIYQARIGLVTLHPTQNYRVSYPINLFEYMAAGIPVVASDFPLWRTILEESGAGLLVDPLDPAAIASAIGYLLKHPFEAEAMGRRGRDAAERIYNWDRKSKKLLDLYTPIASRAPV